MAWNLTYIQQANLVTARVAAQALSPGGFPRVGGPALLSAPASGRQQSVDRVGLEGVGGSVSGPRKSP